MRGWLASWCHEQGRLINNGEHWLSKRKRPHYENDDWVVFFWRLAKVLDPARFGY